MLFDTIIRRKPDPLSIWQEKMKLPFVTDKPIPIEDVTKIISSSECILETDRDGQAGVTLRDMWALASGKKIITTNSYLQNLPYYNDDQIKFIDRENPVIDINFIKTHSIVKASDIYEKQRIDHWVKRVLTFE